MAQAGTEAGRQTGTPQNEPAHRVAWGERSMVQPEHWQISFASPQANTSAEYWVGNDFVTVKRTENPLLATLTNLHKGVGMSVGWVLVIDTLAGSLILLSLTGVLLWTELNRRKTVGAVLVIGSIVAALCVGLSDRRRLPSARARYSVTAPRFFMVFARDALKLPSFQRILWPDCRRSPFERAKDTDREGVVVGRRRSQHAGHRGYSPPAPPCTDRLARRRELRRAGAARERRASGHPRVAAALAQTAAVARELA